MRSNIARTCGSDIVPDRGVPPLTLTRGSALELRDVRHQGVELVRRALLQTGEGRHGRGGVDERARDGLRGQAGADLGQRGPRAAVAVLADLVAGQAARLG